MGPTGTSSSTVAWGHWGRMQGRALQTIFSWAVLVWGRGCSGGSAGGGSSAHVGGGVSLGSFLWCEVALSGLWSGIVTRSELTDISPLLTCSGPVVQTLAN